VSARPFALAPVLAALLVLIAAVAVLGIDPTASPSMTPAAVLEGGDLRSEGEGPGLVGNPLLILGAVVLLGVVTATATVLIAHLLQRDRA
jgi:hypothetical protein